jgi:hypothetical protein
MYKGSFSPSAIKLSNEMTVGVVEEITTILVISKPVLEAASRAIEKFFTCTMRSLGFARFKR